MLTGIIKEQRFHLGGKLANIILQMKIDDVDTEVQSSFCDALKEKISFIAKNGGTPQIIAHWRVKVLKYSPYYLQFPKTALPE